MHDLAILGDLVIIFAIAVLVVAVLRRFGVPSIAGFIVAGTLVGPKCLGLIEDVHQVESLAEVGVALLLFGIGLELNVTRLRRLWKPVVIGGAAQVGMTIAASIAIGLALGHTVRGAIFVGFLTAVSSTAIVLRGLETRGEVEAPHGQLTLGILVFQDLSVVPMMLAIPILAGGGAAQTPQGIAIAMGKTLGVLAFVLWGARLIVPRLLHWVAGTKQRDLFVLMVFLVSIGTAWLATSAGVTLALGAFLAGLVVSGSEYRHQALSDLIPFRETLTSLFFVSIGMLLDWGSFWADFGGILAMLAAILLGKFAIVFLAGTFMRLPARVNILAAAALCQVGEFSFILMRASAGTSLLEPEFEARFLPATILSMLLAPLVIAVGPTLAAGVGKITLLTRFLGVPTAEDESAETEKLTNHVIIAGYGITGQELAICLRDSDIPYVIVDLNPENVKKARAEGEPAYFGDITSVEVLHHLGAERAKEIVLVVNDPNAAERAIAAVRQVAPQAHLIVRARFVADIESLMTAGATKVIPAELEAAVRVAGHVLGRRAVPKDTIDRLIGRIRTRSREEASRQERMSAVPDQSV